MSISPRIILIAVLAGSVSACADARLSHPDVALPGAFESFGAGPGTATPPATLDRWWLLFDDPQLTRLIEEALAASPDARSALQRIAEARATRAQTLAAYLPQGDLVGEAQNQHTSESFSGLGVGLSTLGGGSTGSVGTGTVGTGTVGTGGGTTSGAGSSASSDFLTPAGDLQTYAAQFNVSYELDLFGRQRTARRAADADLAAARFDYEATRSTLATNVASGLFQARGDAIQLADARETLRIARDLADAADLSAAHGLTSTSDAARLETDVANAEAEVTRLEAQALAARRSLLALIGRGAAPLDSLVVTASVSVPPAPPATTPADLLHRRPDVRRDEARLRSTAHNLTLDRLALFPTFDLAPGGQLAKTGGTYDSLTSIWSIGLNAAMPILDRPRLLAVIRGQKARGEAAVAVYEQTVQNAYRDAENGLTMLAADRRRVDRLRVAVQRSRFAFDAKKRAYDLGLTDLTTLLDAERSWRSAQSAFNGAQTTGLVDASTLFQALGGGWSSGEVAARGAADAHIRVAAQ